MDLMDDVESSFWQTRITLAVDADAQMALAGELLLLSLYAEGEIAASLEREDQEEAQRQQRASISYTSMRASLLAALEN